MRELNQVIEAYEDSNVYNFDNHIMFRYYPSRIMEILGEATGKSLLEGGGRAWHKCNNF